MKEVYQFQCDVIVPEGISLDTIKASGIRANSFTATMSKVEDNHYRLVIMNPTETPFAGNDGELFKMTLSVSDEISEGDYILRLNEIVVTDTTSTNIFVPYTISKVSVDNSANVGDVNADGLINVADIMGVVRIILGRDTSALVENAADVNSDGLINVADVMGVVRKILGRDSSSAKFVRYQQKEAE